MTHTDYYLCWFFVVNAHDMLFLCHYGYIKTWKKSTWKSNMISWYANFHLYNYYLHIQIEIIWQGFNLHYATATTQTIYITSLFEMLPFSKDKNECDISFILFHIKYTIQLTSLKMFKRRKCGKFKWIIPSDFAWSLFV